VFRPPGRRRLQDFPKVCKFYQNTRRRVSVDSSVFVVLHWPVFDPYNYIGTEEHAPPPPPHPSISRWRYILESVIFCWTLVVIWLHGYVDVRVWLSVCLSEKKRILYTELQNNLLTEN
jgi:hypothetical protein